MKKEDDCIFGVDVNKAPLTSEDVRNAIVECFANAHGEVIKDTIENLEGEKDGREKCKQVRQHTMELVKKAFRETGGEYESPTKRSIMEVLDYLADFSQNFRDPEVIKKHYEQIMQLVEKIED